MPHRAGLAPVDAQQAVTVIKDILDVRVAIEQPRMAVPHIAVSHVRTPELSVVEVTTSGHVDCHIICGERFVIDTVLGGTLHVDGTALGRYAHGDVFTAGPPNADFRCRADDLRLLAVTLPMSLLRRVNGRSTVRHTSLRPHNEAARSQWVRTVGYVGQLLASAAGGPLLAAHGARLLAATALEVFSRSGASAAGRADNPCRPDAPEAVTHAVDFIEKHAAEDLSLADIAAAVYLTPRAVQYAFRRHLATTPMLYLRTARLRRAHDDLMADGGSGVTVAEVARRWGFGHVGRFAAMYRREYHEAPASTLWRGAGGIGRDGRPHGLSLQ